MDGVVYSISLKPDVRYDLGIRVLHENINSLRSVYRVKDTSSKLYNKSVACRPLTVLTILDSKSNIRNHRKIRPKLEIFTSTTLYRPAYEAIIGSRALSFSGPLLSVSVDFYMYWFASASFSLSLIHI